MARASSSFVWKSVKVSMLAYNKCGICEEDHSSFLADRVACLGDFVMIVAYEANMSNFNSREQYTKLPKQHSQPQKRRP
jgi:hypothetical protein